MRYWLVRELAADGVVVAVACRVVGRQYSIRL